MKDILVLLVLLNAQTTKVCSQPYQAHSNGTCVDPRKEYLLDGSNLCCKRCQPGQRLKQECTETTETVCEPCPRGQFMEAMNYSPNCFSCTKCKQANGLLYAQYCSATKKTKCGCQPGMYCIMGFNDPYCRECRKYKQCGAGLGVSVPGTANSDVKCERCPDGTFSDTVSYKDPCRPHTICHGRVVKKGDTTSDTVCEPEAYISSTQPRISTKGPPTQIVLTTASTPKSMIFATPDPKAPHGLAGSTSVSHLSSVTEAAFNHSTKSPPTISETDITLVIASVIGLILIIIVIILLICCKLMWKKDAERFHPKVDANGNCESADKGYLGKTQHTSFTITSPEQQCLVEGSEACSDQSQCSKSTETSTRTDGSSSYESMQLLQSTMARHSPDSALSEPMTLLSNTEPFTPQPSLPTQFSSSSSSFSQPTSPQIISPVTTSPHVNVNITFHIGNGSGGTPSVMPTDLIQVDSKLPFGEEEESFSIPQQEAGKQSLMSVQESTSYSA